MSPLPPQVNHGAPESVPHKGWKRPAAIIAFSYLAVAFIWIYFSDLAVDQLPYRTIGPLPVQTIKGWLFLSVTAIFLFIIVGRALRARELLAERLGESESTIRALRDALPDVIVRVGRDLRVLDMHVPDPSLLLKPASAYIGRRLSETTPIPAAVQTEEMLTRLFREGRQIAFETVSPSAFGEQTWDVRMVLSRAGEAIIIGRNVTGQRAVERREGETRERLESLVRRTPIGVIFWDERVHFVSWNPAAEQIFGWSEAEVRGKSWELIVPPSERATISKVTEALSANRGGIRSTNRNIRKDGRIIVCEWYNTSLVDHSGRVTGIASVVEDVTERREAERRQALMVRELDHRVKNNLASITALAELTARSTRDHEQFLAAFTGRLRAMARVHSLLTRSQGRGATAIALVRQTLDPFGVDGEALARTTMDGPEVELDARVAQGLAMALNELATNAAKYGSLSVPDGRVRITWTLSDAKDRIEMTWTERGGPPITPPTHKGFGTDLIEGMISHELGGTVALTYDPAGLVAILSVPLQMSAPSENSHSGA